MPLPLEGTGQAEEDDVDGVMLSNQSNIMRANAPTTVENWIRSTLTVQDDPVSMRFIVRIGRLTFPVGYEQLAKETTRLVGIDPAEAGADVTKVSVYQYRADDETISPVDLKKEAADAKAKEEAEEKEFRAKHKDALIIERPGML